MAYDATKNAYATNAPIADLGTAGTSTVAQLEAKINALLAALRVAGVVSN